METVKDPLTGEVFVPSRSNQKFATRQNQVRFNNRKGGQKRKAKATTDRILDENRNILKKLLGSKTEETTSLDYLLGAGFHFGYITHNSNKDGNRWIGIYEYFYTNVSENTFKIIKSNGGGN